MTLLIGRKGCTHGECSRSQKEEQEGRESVWETASIRVQASVCEVTIERRITGFAVE